MSIEKLKFNQSEQQEASSIETEKRLMSPEEVEQELGDMGEFVESLKVLLSEKQEKLVQLEWHPGLNEEEIGQVKSEILELEEQISGLEEFRDEGEEALERGEQFLIEK